MRWIEQSLAELRDRARLRLPVTLEPESATCARLDGRTVTVFCGNDYLGLRFDAPLAEAARAATERFGTGSGASRLVSGNTTVHEEAEASLARWLGTESALLTTSGYVANLGALAALAEADDVVFSDALNHASIVDGCRLSRARIVVYPHGDVAALTREVERHRPFRRGWVVTESLFSMDGDLAPLADLAALCAREQLHLYVDEAHALGSYGTAGQGLAAQLGVTPAVLVGTLGKALGGAGAFIAGSKALRLFLWNHCRGFVFSTGIAPGLAAVAHAAVGIVSREGSLRDRLSRNVALLRAALDAGGTAPGSDPRSPIVPWRVGDDQRALALSASLLEDGFFVQAIRPPTVPAGTARLRIAVSAAHTPNEIEAFARSLLRATARIAP